MILMFSRHLGRWNCQWCSFSIAFKIVAAINKNKIKIIIIKNSDKKTLPVFGNGTAVPPRTRSRLYWGTGPAGGVPVWVSFLRLVPRHCLSLPGFRMAFDKANEANNAQSYMSGTPGVNSTPFHCSSKALVVGHQVWTATYYSVWNFASRPKFFSNSAPWLIITKNITDWLLVELKNSTKAAVFHWDNPVFVLLPVTVVKLTSK